MNDTIKAISLDENVRMEHVPFENSTAMGKYMSNELNLLMTLAGVEFDDALAGGTQLFSNMNIKLR